MALIKCPMCGEDLHGEKICGNCKTDISKLEDTACKGCNGILEKCPGCNNPITEYTEICSQCGYNISELKDKVCKFCDKIIDITSQKDAEHHIVNKDGKNINKKERKVFLVAIPCVIFAIVLLIVYNSVHIYADATCTEPKTCKICKKTEGYALHHQWIIECEKVKTCKRCGLEQGKPIKHSWKDATCTEPKTCSKCGKKEGEALGHKGRWRTDKDATLYDTGSEYEICERCYETLDTNKIDKKKPEVVGEHFNFDGLEFIKYIDDYADSLELHNTEVDVDGLNTLIADNTSKGGLAFSAPIYINSNKEVDLIISQNKEGYVDAMYVKGSDKSKMLMVYAIVGASLTNSIPYEFLTDLSNDNEQKGMIFYERNNIKFIENIEDNVLFIMPVLN